MNNQDLRPFYCQRCGRFLGYECLVDGSIYIFCKNCKGWTVLLEGKVELGLTGQQIYDKIRAKAEGPRSR